MDVIEDLEMSVTEADGDNQGTSDAMTGRDNETDVVMKIEPGDSGEPTLSQRRADNNIAGNNEGKNTNKSAKRKRPVQTATTSKGNKVKKKVKRKWHYPTTIEKCQAEKVHYQVMGWLAVNYRYNPDITGWNKMISLDDLYCKYSDYKKGDPVCDQTCIARCAEVMFGLKRFFKEDRRYFPVKQYAPEKPSAVVTLPPSCSSYYDGLDLIVKVKTTVIIDGYLVHWYIIWSDTKISVKFRDRVITLIEQAPPKHWVAFTQDNLDRILSLCEKIPLCRGFETHDDHLEDPKVVVEGWANLADPDRLDCRTRHKYCQIVSMPSGIHSGCDMEAVRSKAICSKCANKRKIVQRSIRRRSSERMPQKPKRFLEENAGQIQAGSQIKTDSDKSTATASSGEDSN